MTLTVDLAVENNLSAALGLPLRRVSHCEPAAGHPGKAREGKILDPAAGQVKPGGIGCAAGHHQLISIDH